MPDSELSHAGPISDAVKAKPGVGSQDQRQPLTVAEKSPFSVSQGRWENNSVPVASQKLT